MPCVPIFFEKRCGMISKNWMKAMGVRAVKTFAQTLISLVTVGQMLDEVDWINAVSIAGTAAILSALTSIAGLPEVHE